MSSDGERGIKCVKSTCSILHSYLIAHTLSTENENNIWHEKKIHTDTHTA